MRSSNIWPIHPKPQHNEILSSWIIRTAHANGAKVQTLTRKLFGQDNTAWIRDIDRNPPFWLLDSLSFHTGVTNKDMEMLSLRKYINILYSEMRLSGQLQWILPIFATYKKNNDKLNSGPVFCPLCLQEDIIPYYRASWRISFYTFCPQHMTMMVDKCPNCNSNILFRKIDFNRSSDNLIPIHHCYKCGQDLRTVSVIEAIKYDDESFHLFRNILIGVDEINFTCIHPDLESVLNVAHQFCKLILSRRTEEFRYYIENQLKRNYIDFEITGSIIERQSITNRHYIFSLACWIMVDLRVRLNDAWNRNTILYNKLTKDMKYIPDWYSSIIEPFNRRSQID